VRTDEWKYLRYVDNPSIEELYDLRVDPEETINLATDSAHLETLDILRAKLEQLSERYELTSGQ
jgi:arylsulfatase A-like enzyme